MKTADGRDGTDTIVKGVCLRSPRSRHFAPYRLLRTQTCTKHNEVRQALTKRNAPATTGAFVFLVFKNCQRKQAPDQSCYMRRFLLQKRIWQLLLHRFPQSQRHEQRLIG